MRKWFKYSPLKKRAIEVKGNFGAVWPEDRRHLWPMESVENALKVFLDHDEATIILGLLPESKIIDTVKWALLDAYDAQVNWLSRGMD